MCGSWNLVWREAGLAEALHCWEPRDQVRTEPRACRDLATAQGCIQHAWPYQDRWQMESSKPVSSEIRFCPRDSGQLHRTLKGQPVCSLCAQMSEAWEAVWLLQTGCWHLGTGVSPPWGFGRWQNSRGSHLRTPSAMYPRCLLATFQHPPYLLDVELTIPGENHRNGSRFSSLPCVVLCAPSPLTRHKPGLMGRYHLVKSNFAFLRDTETEALTGIHSEEQQCCPDEQRCEILNQSRTGAAQVWRSPSLQAQLFHVFPLSVERRP